MSRPRLGFLGTGWIGRHRMAALAATGLAEIVAVAEPDDNGAAEALKLAPGARRWTGWRGCPEGHASTTRRGIW